ncbi:radical SAM/SPASM domain-containing protein [Oceanirhabdus sp. W0125-5]|uniref:radical SAM/SPASM domain-containing protein n=1 Tax=Oceanirhabdus sp. W0125-5 TaxID=2999116 RepID=UPI0022F2C0AE|nr:radical SAM protein [Oceanirhabdus sp. W0125-5]WBW96422.1 radical SAM protein [Oceanirhabdus sp. W0125-5]
MDNNEKIIVVNESVIARDIQGKFTLIDRKTGDIYTFNEVMKKIWNHLHKGTTVNELIDICSLDNEDKVEQLMIFLDKLFITKLISSPNWEYKGEKRFTPQNSTYEKICNQKRVVNRVLIELTEKCNLRCKHCYIEERKNEFDVSNLNKLLDELKEIGALTITYSGGEIFNRDDIFEIIDLTLDKGFIVNIITNCTLIDEEIIQKIEDRHITQIQSSIYGFNEITHDSITRSIGSYDKTINVLRKLGQQNKKCVVNYVVFEENANEIKKTKELLESINVEMNLDYRIFPTRGGSRDPIKFGVKMDTLKGLFRDEILERPYDIKCGAGREVLVIKSDGEVYPCEYINFSFGNIANSSIKEIWNNSKMMKLLEAVKQYNPKECIGCKYKEYCTRCPAMVWENHEYKNIKDEIMCIRAKSAYSAAREEGVI